MAIDTTQARNELAKRAPNGGGNRNAVTINSLLGSVAIKSRFQEILGDKAAGFMSSIINVTKSNALLMAADPNSIIASAAVAASLDLPIDPNLGFAYIVPYKGAAQFQMGYKGFVQLALRTGAYATINVGVIYKGEIKRPTARDRIKGELAFVEDAEPSDEVAGYAAYFRLTNGAEKWEYMSLEDVKAHAKRFSQSYKSGRNSPWQTDFDAMAQKTVLKRLLSHWGIMSIEMQTAMKADQAVVHDGEDGEHFEYVDATATVREDDADAPAESPPADTIDSPPVDWEKDFEQNEPPKDGKLLV